MSRSARELLRAALTGAGAVAAATALVLAPALSASAHNQLISANPAADSTTTTAIAAVTLEFNEDVLDLGDAGSASIVQVTDTDGKHFETACAATDRKSVTVPVALGEGGEYTVAYSIVSADGHRVSADYSFQYQPADGAATAAGTATSPCEAVASNESDNTENTSTVPIILGIAGGVVGLAAIGVILALVLTRRKPEVEE